MDWKLAAAAFGAVFLAELGDKTQLAALTLSAQSRSPWAVMLGASAALILATAIGVAAGAALGAYLPEVWIKRGAGALFVAIGLAMLAGKL